MSKISIKPSSTGTGTYTIEAPSGNLSKTLMLPDEDGTLTTAEQVLANKITLGEAKAATGVAVDFTGIPSWAKRVTVMFDGVSTNGTSSVCVRIGDTSIHTSGYSSVSTLSSGTSVDISSDTSSFVMRWLSASHIMFGVMVIEKMNNTFMYVQNHNIATLDGPRCAWGAGSKTLSHALSQIRITTENGTNQFDDGTINISWE